VSFRNNISNVIIPLIYSEAEQLKRKRNEGIFEKASLNTDEMNNEMVGFPFSGQSFDNSWC
jgi:hypothetical protein